MVELSTSADRVTGWKRALRKAGLAAPRELAGEGNWTAESGHAVALEFLRSERRPTAIFAANFLMMTGVLRALRDLRRKCPQDVEVMSSDDSEWLDVFTPPISTVAQPSYAMGAKAAELLAVAVHDGLVVPGVEITGAIGNEDLVVGGELVAGACVIEHPGGQTPWR